MVKRIPYRVGKMGQEQNHLKNTYLITNGGLLIPDTLYFFEDTFRSVGDVKSFSEFAEPPYDGPCSSSQFLDQIVAEGKQDIDEILAIVDPKNSFGISSFARNGKFLPDTLSFFNTPALRGLFERLSKPQYNFDKNMLSDNYTSLEHYWQSMKEQFYSYIKRLREETGDELPRGCSELDLRFVS